LGRQLMNRRVTIQLTSALLMLACMTLSLQAVRARESSQAPVTVSGTRLMFGGRELIVKGINYFPAYYPPLYPHSWLSAPYYNPTVIERELAAVQKLGFNLVSIQSFPPGVTPSPKDCEDLQDFLGRAKRHNLLVDLFIGAGGIVPISDPAALAVVPRTCGLAGNPTIFAYDIAWEAHFGIAPRRSALESRWKSWLAGSYGSIPNAIRAFGGSPAMPSDAELCSDRASVRIAAYRRFLDDTLSENYKDVRLAIRAVDSTHLIEARSGYGGNGSQPACPLAPVDLRAASKYLDVVSPEGYALDPTNIHKFMSRGEFTTAYADVGKPIIWAEFGINADGSCGYCSPEVQASFFREMWSLVKDSKANGAIGWWLVGSRPQATGDSERSDFGILYDYVRYPTAVDGEGERIRNGILQLCFRKPYVMRMVDAGRDSGMSEESCYGGLRSEGKFLSSVNSPLAGGRSSVPSDNWKELCSSDREAELVVTRNDVTKATYGCPQGYKPAGSFKPAQDNTPPMADAVDAQGRVLTSGWVTLCVKNDFAILKVVFERMSQQREGCPTGFAAGGSFSPEDKPVFRPAALEVRGALRGASAANRHYTSWITVDRDEYGGDWKMYEDGTQRYAVVGRPDNFTGVRTPCFGTTSKRQRLCVGDQPFSSSCPSLCLDAVWNSIEIRDRDGRWRSVHTGDTVAVTANTPVYARLSAGNIGQSKWLTLHDHTDLTGTVRFGCNENAGDIGCRVTVRRDVLPGMDAASGEAVISPGVARNTNVTFQMVSENVAWFGQRISIAIVPR
jgi:hypothetical protein